MLQLLVQFTEKIIYFLDKYFFVAQSLLSLHDNSFFLSSLYCLHRASTRAGAQHQGCATRKKDVEYPSSRFEYFLIRFVPEWSPVSLVVTPSRTRRALSIASVEVSPRSSFHRENPPKPSKNGKKCSVFGKVHPDSLQSCPQASPIVSPDRTSTSSIEWSISSFQNSKRVSKKMGNTVPIR